MTKSARRTASKLKPGMTAAELMAVLEADPEWCARRDRQQREHEAVVAKLREAEKPLVAALRGAGLDVRSIDDLVNTTARYDAALPILIEHLQRDYPPDIREGIARALAVRESKRYWDTLLELFRQDQTTAKDGIAVALAAAADEEVIDDLIELVQERQQGASRGLLLRAFERLRPARARSVLESLAKDPDLEKEIPYTLARMDGRRSRRR